MFSASQDSAAAFPPQLNGSSTFGDEARIRLLEKRLTGRSVDAPNAEGLDKRLSFQPADLECPEEQQQQQQQQCNDAATAASEQSPTSSTEILGSRLKRRKAGVTASPEDSLGAKDRETSQGGEMLGTIPEVDDSSQVAADAVGSVQAGQAMNTNKRKRNEPKKTIPTVTAAGPEFNPAHEGSPPAAEFVDTNVAAKQTPVRNLFGNATPRHQKPAPHSGGAKGPSPSAAHRGQTKLSTFYPFLDGSSRDSGGADFRAATVGSHKVAGSDAAAAATNVVVVASTNQEVSRKLSTGEAGHDVAATATTNNMELSKQAACGSEAVATAPCNSMALVLLQAQVEAKALMQVQAQLDAKERDLASVQEASRQQSLQMQEKLDLLGLESGELRQALDKALQELQEAKLANEDKECKVRSELCHALQQGARGERELQRMQVAAGAARLGTMSVQRTSPMQMHEVWEDGQAYQQLASRQNALTSQREEIESARKSLRKKMPLPPSSKQQQKQAVSEVVGSSDASCRVLSSLGCSSSSSSCAAAEGTLSGLEFVTADEIFKIRLGAMKREEEALRNEEERLNAEKFRHLRLMKRLRDEDSSRFNNLPLLAKRYQLTNLLGKGGFSEVFKAYDLRDNIHVAVKIHQLNSTWNEAKKQSYVKHAIREYDIHKSLHHAHIVGLMDILEIDNNTFATVLDFCDGPDLESVLRENQVLPEKEARSVLAQVFSGLVYMNQPGRRIIHYDLKPANILFDNLGQARITDFGLSKIVEEGQTMGMELTSQGAGTYWYLPPECFEMGSGVGGHGGPRISNKVDVWSVGVIFYQMLYGKRPFGEGLSQEHIMRERVMLNAREVEFPTRPAVSNEAKEFIRRCLAYRQDSRWDVLTAAIDPYMAMTKPK